MTMAARLPLRHPSLRRGRKVAQSCEKWRGATGDVSGRKHWARVKPEMPGEGAFLAGRQGLCMEREAAQPCPP